MKKWEYKIYQQNSTVEITEQTINILGKEGWELVSCFHSVDYFYPHLYFKRELQ